MLIIDQRGGQYELLDWLKNITFPKEAEFADLNFAKKVYNDVVRRSLDCGVCCLSHNVTTVLILLSDDNFVLLWHPSPGSYKDTRRCCKPTR